MKKKFVMASIMVVVVISILVGYSYANLKSNSVYYAKNTPHKKGVEPVLMLLVDNLDWIYNPELEGIEYDFDGGNVIYNNNYKSEDVPWFASHYGKEYHYGSNDYKSYSFNSNFELTYCRDRREGKVDIKNIDVKKVKRDIYKIFQPVINKQTKPLINLQWLFDRIYRAKFN
ncbi:hypothetical protein D3H64_06390 [Atopobacter sp. AH10]|uniref:hypothetical protein n=1 Tax=Atopobacter sp. AH10 TaxID=2315861 RepID=UPI000EF20BE5|nr:hypothetical protein [Atopobacter sp. AH10]RLK63062.1 hypothetical protein D3H64_06390 [Atopobacter sp. AH10]